MFPGLKVSHSFPEDLYAGSPRGRHPGGNMHANTQIGLACIPRPRENNVCATSEIVFCHATRPMASYEFRSWKTNLKYSSCSTISASYFCYCRLKQLVSSKCFVMEAIRAVVCSQLLRSFKASIPIMELPRSRTDRPDRNPPQPTDRPPPGPKGTMMQWCEQRGRRKRPPSRESEPTGPQDQERARNPEPRSKGRHRGTAGGRGE